MIAVLSSAGLVATKVIFVCAVSVRQMMRCWRRPPRLCPLNMMAGDARILAVPNRLRRRPRRSAIVALRPDAGLNRSRLTAATSEPKVPTRLSTVLRPYRRGWGQAYVPLVEEGGAG